MSEALGTGGLSLFESRDLRLYNILYIEFRPNWDLPGKMVYYLRFRQFSVDFTQINL